MQKMIKSIIGITLLSCLFSFHTQAAPAEKELPSYVKWGQIAMTKTKEKYPNSEIIDYKHIGKDTQKSTSIEKFKLIVKQQDKKVGVMVNLTFDTRTERLINVDLKEEAP
ncbi:MULTISPECIES: DUF3889 domain-containing protein [Bacillaceae]|uniref:DUF3889 domain-containing protein n=1 Tax=Bacillaceae TaxID=186817 RepID=UPI001E2C5511|nr:MULTISPECIES: DUF3889 domain-containing protein [Bacillaceae]MCE4047585.1 YqzG/YhdC family protein [Bacillus sp. Au-Bac7]MCM3033852.1 YqzG/YhdC family protein [Niallia sp. MER 6]MDL0436195.1 DUF3889 domain-containing protein [Niallia sp. SS-2023]UPO86070.1 YqzG/YhdC family protein [Niallia sp. Man26]